jgi:hypothetical protein
MVGRDDQRPGQAVVAPHGPAWMARPPGEFTYPLICESPFFFSSSLRSRSSSFSCGRELQRGSNVSHRFFRSAAVSTVLLNSLFGLVLLTSGCGGEQGRGELTPQDKQNIADELKATEQQQKVKEGKVKPSA